MKESHLLLTLGIMCLAFSMGFQYKYTHDINIFWRHVRVHVLYYKYDVLQLFNVNIYYLVVYI